MKFNKAQQRAVTHTLGPCMVLAGPGSGKTTVIVNRIKYLTEELNVPPEKILVITFTRTAAEEMRERYRVLTGGEQGVSFGTFHSLFFKMIRYAYRYDASHILTEDQRIKLLRDAIRTAGISDDPENDLVLALSNEISCVKNSGGEIKGYKSSAVDKDSFFRLFSEFERMLRSEEKIDFDDMLLLSRRLFEENPEALSFWREIYEYILIDEFQDICPLQYELILKLAYPKNNIFIVGDDDQSIYSFRGADPGMMVSFEKEFKSDKRFDVITLGVNYRCSSEIVECSSKLILRNKKRYKKELQSGRGRLRLFSGSTVRFRPFTDIKAENSYVVNMIEDLNGKGIDYSEIAVLYRTNSQPGSLISLLKLKNIPFSVRDAVPNIYEHWIAKNIFAYIELARMSLNDDRINMGDRSSNTSAEIKLATHGSQMDDHKSFRQNSDHQNGGSGSAPGPSEWRRLFLSIANRPVRYITRETMRKEKLDFSVLYQENRDKKYVLERLDKLKYDLKMISALNPLAAVKYIRNAVGYDDFLKKYASERKLDLDGLMSIIEEIEASSREFATYSAWQEHIREYGEALRQKRESRDKEKISGVNLLTFHSAKGTEYDTVFILDASEDFTPYWQAATTAEIEEERRMFYVALTRAKNRLFVLHADERFGRKYEISRFVREADF